MTTQVVKTLELVICAVCPTMFVRVNGGIGPKIYCSPACREAHAMAHRFRTIHKQSTTARGYGASHARARKDAAAKHQPSDPCTRCGKPLGPMGPWLHYDHNAQRTGYLGFAHATCNRQAGAKAGRARQSRSYTRSDW